MRLQHLVVVVDAAEVVADLGLADLCHERRRLEGVVTELHWVVPHSWVYLEVKGAGEVTTWALEAAGPNAIMANGVKREDVKVGDKIKVRCHLLRDGTNGCLLGFITPDHGDMARGHGVEREWD